MNEEDIMVILIGSVQNVYRTDMVMEKDIGKMIVEVESALLVEMVQD